MPRPHRIPGKATEEFKERHGLTTGGRPTLDQIREVVAKLLSDEPDESIVPELNIGDYPEEHKGNRGYER